MKLFLTFLSCLCLTAAQSAILTVSNNPTLPAQYTDGNVAIAAASPTDTIQFTGSTTNYSSLNVTKQLTMVGSGWAGPLLPAKLSYCVVSLAGASSTFQGIVFIDYVNVNSPNCSFIECQIYYLTYNTDADNTLYRNCRGFYRIDGIGIASNVMFLNNVMGWADNASPFNTTTIFAGINSPMSEPTTFANNIIYLLQTHQVSNVVFSNNVIGDILIGNNGYYGFASGACTTCSFNNNLVTCATCDLSNITGSTILLNNIQNQQNQFVSAPQTPAAFTTANTAGINWTTINYDLIPTSLGNNAGTDATDIGVQGGGFPMTNSNAYGGYSSSMPIITSFTIETPVIQQGGTLQIQATSTIPGQ